MLSTKDLHSKLDSSLDLFRHCNSPFSYFHVVRLLHIRTVTFEPLIYTSNGLTIQTSTLLSESQRFPIDI